MDLQMPYLRLRKNMGKQPLFSNVPAAMIDSIDPNPKLMKEFILRNPVHTESQTVGKKSEHEANTRRVKSRTTGCHHAEGGWPKEVNCEDEEATARYRRRWERDEGYVHAVLTAAPGLQHYVEQNNAIDMYRQYFQELSTMSAPEVNQIRNAGVLRDLSLRPVSSMSWTGPDRHAKLVASYCSGEYTRVALANSTPQCLIWDITKQTAPVSTLQPEACCWRLAVCGSDPNLAVGGLSNGKVCQFDLRQGGADGVTYCPEHVAHRDPVSALTYIFSRSGTEFMTGSSDGQCLWWDSRNLEEPIDQMTMTVRVRPGEPINIFNADGVTSLNYDRNMPTRFLAGMETGCLVNVNRKGRTIGEQMSTVWLAHTGPVRAVVRNPQMPKLLACCGDYTVHFFCDDIRTSSIIAGTPSRYVVNDLCFLPERMSTYMTASADGVLTYWDMLRKFAAPVLSMSFSDVALTKLKPHEEGKIVAVGDMHGKIHLASLSENMICAGPNDRQLLTAIYDRESKREHILEARLKEIKLKLRQEAEAGTQTAGAPAAAGGDEKDERTLIMEAEQDYKKTVEQLLRSY